MSVEPLFTGTVWVSPNIITPSVPSTFVNLTYQGIGLRKNYDRRVGFTTKDMRLFEATYADRSPVEFQVNLELENSADNFDLMVKLAQAIGRLPKSLHTSLKTVWLHDGDYAAGGGNDNILFHKTYLQRVISNGFLEEVLLHEASHTSLDWWWKGLIPEASWIAAQKADLGFISTYARDNSLREDVAETFLIYYALKFSRNALPSQLIPSIELVNSNRFKLFEELKLLEGVASTTDVTPPIIAITSNITALTAGQTALITFALSEASTNFTASDVAVSGGTLSNFSGSGTSYTATFIPTANSTTAGVVSVASGVFTDAAGNTNADGLDANNRVSMSVNTVQTAQITPATGMAVNIFMSSSSNDTFVGTVGLDRVIFSGPRSQYSLSAQSAGGFRVTDSVATRNGSLALDLDGNAGKVAKILGAIFGQSAVSNKAYVGIGLSYLDSGMSYSALAALAVSVTGKSSSTEVCTLLWTNVIKTTPTAADIAPYKAMLDSGQMSIGALATLAADTSFNTTNIGLVGLSQTGIEYV
jgi:hypothetical protein